MDYRQFFYRGTHSSLISRRKLRLRQKSFSERAVNDCKRLSQSQLDLDPSTRLKIV